MADDSRELKIVISSDTDQAEKGLTGFGGSLRRIGEIAAGIGLEKVTEKVLEMSKAFVVESVNAFKESENSLAQLNAVLNSTHNAAGLYVEDLTAQAKALQKVTTFSDEEVQSAESLLLTFTNIKGAVFQNALPAILDMSKALGQDLKSSSIQLGKALNDPIQGINALRRVGVSFTDQQREQIKVLVESGQTVKAQNMILKEISTEFGGSATAAAQTFDGKLIQLKNTFNDVQEVIGKTIVQALYPLVQAVTPLIAFISELVSGTRSWNDVITILNDKMSGLGNIVNVIIQLFQTQFKAIMDQVRQIWIEHKEEIKLLAEVIGGALLAALFALAESILVVIQVGLKLVDMYLDLVKTVKEAVMPVINDLNEFYKEHAETVHKIMNIIEDAWDSLAKKVGISSTSIKNIVKDLAEFVLKTLFPAISALDTMSTLAGNVSNAAKSITKREMGGYASGLTLVGERGPELVNLPAGSYVSNNQQTKQMLGSNTTVNINNPSISSQMDVDNIINQIKLALGRETELARLRAL